MRLGQLSRKVSVKPTEILSYLKNEFDVELGSHLNTKVEDALTEKVMVKFAPPKEKKSEENEVEKPVQEVVETPVVATPVDEVVVETEITEESLDGTPEVIEFEPNQEVDAETIQNAELIKAPKVELTGPTVIGKIELPPTLEEQMVEVDGVMMSKAELARRKKEERMAKRDAREEARGTNKRTSSKARTSRAKSEAQLEQMKRDKEAEEMAKKIELREKRIAAKKKAEAKAKAKPAFVPKPAKKKTKAAIAVEEKKKVEAAKPKPTTWYGKLWLWFNT